MSDCKVGDVVSIVMPGPSVYINSAIMGEVVAQSKISQSIKVECYHFGAMRHYWFGEDSVYVVWCAS